MGNPIHSVFAFGFLEAQAMHPRTHTHQPNQPVGQNHVRYTRGRLQEHERTSRFLMEANIRVCLTHFKDRLYGHYMEHARYFRELARTSDEDLELSYKEYTNLKAQFLLEKRQEEEWKQRVEQRKCFGQPPVVQSCL